MCMMSMVYDHYGPRIPDIQPMPIWNPPNVAPPEQAPPAFDLAKAMRDFQEAKDKAARLDELLQQKDCWDAEKGVLDQRIRDLEALLRKPPEFVLVKGAKLAPGVYRVIDGVLYKVVDEAPEAAV